MNKLLGLVIFCSMLILSGCASIPPESVNLSSTVGQQLLVIKKSHIAYINNTYTQLENQANQAVDGYYGPALIEAALNGASGKTLMEKLEAGKNGGEDSKVAVQYVTEFVTYLHNKIEVQRASVLGPIKEHQAAALANVDAAWTQVIQGNSTITAYLMSLVKVREAQDQLFATIGLPDIQTKTTDALTVMSNDINSLTSKGNAASTDLTKLTTGLQNAVDKLKQ